MERIFGLVVYMVGLVIMTTMILNALEIINQTGPIGTVAFLFFGYLLCVTGYFFARKSARYG